MKKEETIAVITGDVVDSSVLSEAEKRFFQQKIEAFSCEGILLKPRFYRGDSFQLAVEPRIALWLALKFRAEIKRWKEANDVRISVGIGEAAGWNEDVLLASGTAFERSGKNLDRLKKLALNIFIATENEELNQEFETYCYMADSIYRNLTAIQANVVYHRLDGLSQNDMSRLLGISQPAVSKSLKAANWLAVEKFLNRYEQIIAKYYGTPE